MKDQDVLNAQPEAVTNDELLELDNSCKLELLDSVVDMEEKNMTLPPSSKQLTTKCLADAMSLINAAMDILVENDPNVKRSHKVSRGVYQQIRCYKEICDSRKAMKQHSNIESEETLNSHIVNNTGKSEPTMRSATSRLIPLVGSFSSQSMCPVMKADASQIAVGSQITENTDEVKKKIEVLTNGSVMTELEERNSDLFFIQGIKIEEEATIFENISFENKIKEEDMDFEEKEFCSVNNHGSEEVLTKMDVSSSCSKSEPHRKGRPANIYGNYEEIMDILDREDSDICCSNDEDEDWVISTNQIPSNALPLEVSDSNSDSESDEDITLSNLQSKGQKGHKGKVNWKKRVLGDVNVSWIKPADINDNVDRNDSSDIEENSCFETVLPTPYEMFKEYISDEIMELLALKTNQYSIVKDGQSILTNAMEMEVLLGVHVKMGTLGFPRCTMYWSPGTMITDISTNITKNRFFKLRTCLHLVDVNNRPADTINNRLWKVQPLIETVRQRCLQVPRGEHYSIDEMMIPFTGKLNIKQYIKGKPNPWGIKMFCLCTSTGILSDFIPYQGATTPIDEKFKAFGLGGSVVMQLCSALPDHHNFKITFDNYFTSLSLMRELKTKGFFCVGTIRNNRLENCPLNNEKELKKSGRGSYDYRVDADGITVLRWYDNKVVTLASSYLQIGDESEVRRWDKKKKDFQKVKMPETVKTYNSNMGGVDQIDQLLAYYRIFIRSRKWTLRFIFHMVDLSICNAWQEYCTLAKKLKKSPKEIMDLLKFRESVTDGLLRCKKDSTDLSKRSFDRSDNDTPSSKRFRIRPKPRPTVSTRFDLVGHWPRNLKKKNSLRCAYEMCKKKSIVECMKCNVPLCVKAKDSCFYLYHHQ